jgi:hypothetical protein
MDSPPPSRPASAARCLIVAAFALLGCPPALPAAEHPFILWTREEAQALRKKVETEPWAKRQFERMEETGGVEAGDAKGGGKAVKGGKGGLGAFFKNLFAYQVMGDAKAGEAEKRALLQFAGQTLKDKSRYYAPYPDVLRYDVLYDVLSPEERKAIEDTFRVFIDHHLNVDRFQYSREAWLPNMQWNRVMGTHLMAVALRDEKLIRAMFESNGGWKYYFDDYVADGAFYFEEFAKQYSMITEMILWCRGLDRLGLDRYGFGYTGKGGASMRSYLDSFFRLGYPRIETAWPRPATPRVTMGDAGDLHVIVRGFRPDGSGGNARWSAARMNGGVPRVLEPLWFEFAHAKWPDASFDYLLAQLRAPDEDKYYPSLFFLAEPVDPARVKPPAAPSYVARERGFALLRAEETPAYWESPAPAVAFQQATYYMHYTIDCFSILQFVAFNQLLYVRRGVSQGYAGGCPWTDHIRANTGVVVDGLRARAVGPVPVRAAFDPLVKYIAAHGKPLKPYPPVPAEESTEDFHQKGCYRAMARNLGREIYPGVDLERALFLTREYLFDVFRVSSETPREYHWQVQAAAWPALDPAHGWKASDDLHGKLYRTEEPGVLKMLQEKPAYYDLKQVRKREPGGEAWDVTFVKSWQPGGVGVRVMLLGEPGTTAYLGHIAEPPPADGAAAAPAKAGHTTLIVARRAPATVFAAIHEPFEKGRPSLAAFRRIQRTEAGVAVAVAGPPDSGVNDRLLYQFFTAPPGPVTLAGGGETFTFSDRAYLRIRQDRVEVSGNLKSARIKVSGRPILVVDGKEAPATIDGDVLVIGGGE